MAGKVTRRLWLLVALILAVLLVKFFVADVYRIDSDSMRPTLFGGEAGEALTEWVLVRYDHGLEPERFDLVVARIEDSERPIVKRVVGLGGESIRLDGGDPLIYGLRLNPDVVRPAPILVFDDELFDVAEYFDPQVAPAGPWTREGDEWRLEALEVAPGSNQGMMFYQLPLRDDYIMPSGLRVEGKRQVNDAVLEVRFLLEDALVDRLRFQLTEQGDVFEVRIGSHPHDEGFYIVRLHRGNAREDTDIVQANVELATDRWYSLRFSNVDDHLTVVLPEADLELVADYQEEGNVPDARSAAQHGKKSFGDRVALGGEGCRVRFTDLRILRDVYYTDVDEHGTRTDQILPEGEYFLLGDNSAHSKDSRAFGPVPGRAMIGQPVAVVWPPSRMRWLGR